MLSVPHTLTASRVSVTKAGGLSDTPGAERSPDGKNGDTVTHIWGEHRCAHPTTQNVLYFMQLFGTFDKIVCSRPPAYFKVQ